MLIKYTRDLKSQTWCMHYLFQSTIRPTSHQNGWSFRIYMIPLQDFVPDWNSRPGTRTGVNSHRGNSHRHYILWQYHVNKYRAVRGNRSELAPVPHKHPLSYNFNKFLFDVSGNLSKRGRKWKALSIHYMGNIFLLYKESCHTIKFDSLTLKMTTAQVVETSVPVNNNSPIQDCVHPDDQTQLTFEMTPGFKPFTQSSFRSNTFWVKEIFSW